jgi:DNA polymerase sigma
MNIYENIVKLDHRRTGISIDICLNNTSGLSTGKLIKGKKKYRYLNICLYSVKTYLHILDKYNLIVRRCICNDAVTFIISSYVLMLEQYVA